MNLLGELELNFLQLVKVFWPTFTLGIDIDRNLTCQTSG